MSQNGGSRVLVLYKVINSGTDPDGGLYNAFYMPRGSGPTLRTVKQHCAASRVMNHNGPDGYHWRVRVDEKAASSSSSARAPPQFSWWDVQDENAKLPVKDAPMSEIEHMFSPAKRSAPAASHSSGVPGAKAKGMLGKAMNAVAGAVDGNTTVTQQDIGPRMSVIAFKLLDLVKMEEKFSGQNGRSRKTASFSPPTSTATPVRRAPAPAPRPAPAPAAPQPARQTRGKSAPTMGRPQRGDADLLKKSVNLMAFDANAAAAPAAPRSAPTLHHASSLPTGFQSPAPAPAPAVPKTKEEKLKELQSRYKKNEKKQNRVWDPVDERWVAVGTHDAPHSVKPASASAPPGAHGPLNPPKKKAVGIKLDESNAAGKSANVQSAVKARVDDMKKSQEEAVKEVREREAKKKKDEDAEDAVRAKLEPKIKAWSEEHGKKKQLRALLSSLHTILWPDAKWKAVSLGDILDDSKCKRCFHKASRVVHPDKTGHLDAEKRFLAKRIFDALSQAKAVFDNA